MSDNACTAVSACPYQQAQQEEEPEYTITIQCDHRAGLPYMHPIGLVPTIGLTVPYREMLQVVYEGPDPPDSLEAAGVNVEGGGGHFQAQLSIDPGEWFYGAVGRSEGLGELAELTVIDVFRRMWTYHSKHSYTLIGMPVSIPVTIHNPEQWKVKLSIPPARQCKIGAKYGTHQDSGSSHHSVQYSTHDHSTNTSTSASGSVTQSSSGTSVSASSSESQRRFSGFTVERNGAIMQYDGANTILAIMSVIRLARELIKSIQDNAPQVGWYCEFDIAALDADVEFQWGWKEHTDERAFYAVAAQAAVNLIKIKLEFGFGIKNIAFKAQIFAQGQGAVPLSLNVDRHSPDQGLRFVTGVSGNVTFTVGARAQVAYIFRCEANVQTGISVGGDFTIQLDGDKGLGLNAAIQFSGVIGTVSWSIGPGGGGGGMRAGGQTGSQRQREFVKPKKLWDWEWPKEYEDTSEVNGERFQELLYQQALRHIPYDLQVKERYGGDRTSSSDFVGHFIAEDFRSRFYRTNILRDRKSIDGLCSLVRIRLEEIIDLQGRGNNALTLQNFNYFMSQEMPGFMEDMIDPLSDYESAPSSGHDGIIPTGPY